MHILIINQYFPPDTSATAKVASLVGEVLAQHHRVTVLAGRPSYNPTRRHPLYLLRRESLDKKLVVERVGSTAFARERMWCRLSNYLSYLVLAIPRALTIRADMILAMTDPPVAGIMGALIARIRRRPFIYYIQDLHPDMAIAAGIVQQRLWVKLWEHFHCWALRQADRIIVIGDDMRKRVMAKEALADPIKVVVNGAPIQAPVSTRDHQIVRHIRAGSHFVIVHAGNIGFYGAWETLIQAARELSKDNVDLVFIGNGAMKSRIESMASGCRSIRFLPFQPAEAVPYVLAAGDLHVVTLRRGLEGLVVPSKVYPILAAGRPVLAVVPEASDVARIVSRAGCGVVANPDESASVIAAVRALLHKREQLDAMSQKARDVATEYDSFEQLNRLLQVVEEIGVLQTEGSSWQQPSS